MFLSRFYKYNNWAFVFLLYKLYWWNKHPLSSLQCLYLSRSFLGNGVQVYETVRRERGRAQNKFQHFIRKYLVNRNELHTHTSYRVRALESALVFKNSLSLIVGVLICLHHSEAPCMEVEPTCVPAALELYSNQDRSIETKYGSKGAHKTTGFPVWN